MALKRTVRLTIKGVLYLFAFIAVGLSFLPLAPWNEWWIRMLDFPRLQVSLISLVILGGLIALFKRRNAADYVSIFGLLCALSYQGWNLIPYTGIYHNMAIETAPPASSVPFKVLSANVQMTSDKPGKLLDIVRRHDPDIFLALETNPEWERALSVLTNTMPYHVQHLSTNYFGMDLYSRFPLADSEVRFFSNENVPAMLTDVQLPGGQRIRFFGIHPRPPQVGQSSADRDAQLMSAALAAREEGPPVVLAGDLNAVPWERVTRRLLRVGRLLDPRVGRGYMASYSATSWFESWPLDHIFFQDAITLRRLEVLPEFGSDHYPVFAELSLAPQAARVQSAPHLNPNDLRQALIAIHKGRTEEEDENR